MSRAPVRVVSHPSAPVGMTLVEFPVLLFFDKWTTDGRLLRGPAAGGRFTARSLPIPIIRYVDRYSESLGAITTLEVHDTHVAASGWVRHSTGAVVPAVDLSDFTIEHALLRAARELEPRMTVAEFTLAAVTLHPAGAPGSAWPDMPEAIFTIPLEPGGN